MSLFKLSFQSLKNEFCITNVLCHLLFCSRSPSSRSQCRQCSPLFIEKADDFVSSIKYHFSLIFKNNVFCKQIESLFVQSRKLRFNSDVLYLSESHFRLVNSKQNCCMKVLVVKQPSDIIVSLSEVCVRILIDQVVSIFNFPGKFDLTLFDSTTRDLFLDCCITFICFLYFDVCKLLRPSGLNFAPNVDYSAETFKIINKSYLDYCIKMFIKEK